MRSETPCLVVLGGGESVQDEDEGEEEGEEWGVGGHGEISVVLNKYIAQGLDIHDIETYSVCPHYKSRAERKDTNTLYLLLFFTHCYFLKSLLWENILFLGFSLKP